MQSSRSFTGAWIETHFHGNRKAGLLRRSFTGAWIETFHRLLYIPKIGVVAPSQERGLKHLIQAYKSWKYCVAPSQERGLKQDALGIDSQQEQVAPSQERGLKPVAIALQDDRRRRSFTGAWIETANIPRESRK